jgi:hypothetical protein
MNRTLNSGVGILDKHRVRVARLASGGINGCYCGVCPKCIRSQSRVGAGVVCRCRQPNCDCALWEQVWRERIEDPAYYRMTGAGCRTRT